MKEKKKKQNPGTGFTGYQKFAIAMLAFLQFTVVLDFMILSPLGAILIKDMNISPEQFGLVVSAYAFSAGISGILSATYADRFDRKKLLMFFYTGFIIGTLFCAAAPTYHLLFAARVFTGFFGGVIGSISLSIVTDLFPLEKRGSVMGVIQSSFSASQIMGIPIGLFLANHFSWHAAFGMIVIIGAVVGVLMQIYFKPVNAHLALMSSRKQSPVQHLVNTASNPRYMTAFLATMLISTGGFMLQPFASAFSVNNLGVAIEKLPMVYMIAGMFALVGGPYLGRLSDIIGKYRMFTAASIVSCFYLVWYTGLQVTPLWIVIAANALMALLISSRISSSMALISAIPDPQDRGAYMAISSSFQQLAGGVASAVAGMLIVQNSAGKIMNYRLLGWVVAATMILTVLQLFNVNRTIQKREEVKSSASDAALPAEG